MLFGTLAASVLGNLLEGKRKIGTGESTIRASRGTIRAGQSFECRLIL